MKNVFSSGDKVQININSIKSRQDYERLSSKYKRFVEDAAGKTFTVCDEGRHELYSLLEHPEWLFWSGDLVRVVKN